MRVHECNVGADVLRFWYLDKIVYYSSLLRKKMNWHNSRHFIQFFDDFS